MSDGSYWLKTKNSTYRLTIISPSISEDAEAELPHIEPVVEVQQAEKHTLFQRLMFWR